MIAEMSHGQQLKRANGNPEAICVSHRASANMFCMQCNSYMCMQCFEAPTHAGHIILSINNARQRIQAKEQQLLDSLNATLIQVDQQIEHLRSQQAGRDEFVSAAIERIAHAERELHRIITQFCTTLTTELLQQADAIECGERSELLARTIQRDECDRLRRELSRMLDSLSMRGQLLARIADSVNKVHGQPADVTVGEVSGQGGGSAEMASGSPSCRAKRAKLDDVLSEPAMGAASDTGNCVELLLSRIGNRFTTRVEEWCPVTQNEQNGILRTLLLRMICQSKIQSGQERPAARVAASNSHSNAASVYRLRLPLSMVVVCACTLWEILSSWDLMMGNVLRCNSPMPKKGQLGPLYRTSSRLLRFCTNWCTYAECGPV